MYALNIWTLLIASFVIFFIISMIKCFKLNVYREKSYSFFRSDSSEAMVLRNLFINLIGAISSVMVH